MLAPKKARTARLPPCNEDTVLFTGRRYGIEYVEWVGSLITFAQEGEDYPETRRFDAFLADEYRRYKFIDDLNLQFKRDVYIQALQESLDLLQSKYRSGLRTLLDSLRSKFKKMDKLHKQNTALCDCVMRIQHEDGSEEDLSASTQTRDYIYFDRILLERKCKPALYELRENSEEYKAYALEYVPKEWAKLQNKDFALSSFGAIIKADKYNFTEHGIRNMDVDPETDVLPRLTLEIGDWLRRNKKLTTALVNCPKHTRVCRDQHEKSRGQEQRYKERRGKVKKSPANHSSQEERSIYHQDRYNKDDYEDDYARPSAGPSRTGTNIFNGAAAPRQHAFRPKPPVLQIRNSRTRAPVPLSTSERSERPEDVMRRDARYMNDTDFYEARNAQYDDMAPQRHQTHNNTNASHQRICFGPNRRSINRRSHGSGDHW